MFYIINTTRENSRSLGPRLPEGTGFSLLAEPNNTPAYALYQCGRLEHLESSDDIQPVDEELESLLESAMNYPPALAFTQGRIKPALARYYAPEALIPKSVFVERLKLVLQHYLHRQRQDKFFLAQAQVVKVGYLHPPGFYWIVGYQPKSKTVSWVARDYHIYESPLASFQVDESEIRSRFA